ncbi:hypothetical protein FK85_28845 [Halorubrum saccharovorum]|uniref:GP-PDE domain-containing protein n=1 Tax=Halorubrum saccharovorum TaxID=2248 RepID=A0A0F8AUS5_9EURY|nr:hypothetical protein FK85_28845 [Halorubrum saccharovorum]
MVGIARDAGRAVNAWTVETWLPTDRLAAAGVDGVITDYSVVGKGRKREDRGYRGPPTAPPATRRSFR